MGMAESDSQSDPSRDNLRDLLTRVAAGAVSPADAAARLAGSEAGAAPVGEPLPSDRDGNDSGPKTTLTAPGGMEEPHPPVPVDRVRITAFAREIKIVGDASVARVVVEGEHSMRQEGGTLVIDTDHRPGDYRMGESGNWVRELRSWIDGVSQVPTRQLRVRINPSLPLDIDTPAGSVQITGVHADLSFRVGAGKVRLDDFFGGTLNGQVETGSMHVDALLTDGQSTLRADLGSMHVKLRKGSSVQVSSRTDMGKVHMSGHHPVKGSGTQSCMVGSGAGSLQIDVAMGSAQVQLP
jgi:hypothetical protein